VLRLKPEEYTRPPRCSDCGSSSFRIDAWMTKRNTRAMGCTCAGYHFMHRRGSLFCWHRADGSDRYPGDPDFADRNYDGLAA
jgi:hypothetical protein